MPMKKLLLAATMLTLPLAAGAQPVDGFYVAGGLGANLRATPPFNAPYTNLGDPSASLHDERFKLKTRTGIAGVVSAGWGFGNGLRAEVEASIRNNEGRSGTYRFVDGEVHRFSKSTGTMNTLAFMGNVFYDLQLGPVTPYVGLGIGYAFNNQQHTGGFEGTLSSAQDRFNQTKGSLAYQGILGVAYPISAVPGLSVTAEYRYFASDAVNMTGTWATNGALQGSQNPRRLANENHSALLGLRYAFGAPAVVAAAAEAPAAAATPAPASIARTYLVFFDWDRAELTSRAREIIKEAASNAQRGGVTRVEVAGHADRSGDAAYNQRLSQRRAEAVGAELVRDGVTRSNISIQAFGESRPLVPTADNVREPQNRRVEIVLR